jgi:hypothetical protein
MTMQIVDPPKCISLTGGGHAACASAQIELKAAAPTILDMRT